MLGSTLRKGRFGSSQGLLAVPLLAAYLALSALSAYAGIDAMKEVLEPIQQASSDAPSKADSALSLGGDLLP